MKKEFQKRKLTLGRKTVVQLNKTMPGMGGAAATVGCTVGCLTASCLSCTCDPGFSYPPYCVGGAVSVTCTQNCPVTGTR
jgi:hypothetical protein